MNSRTRSRIDDTARAVARGAATAVCLAAVAAEGVTLHFDPADQAVMLGDQASVNVLLGDPDNVLIGTFDLNVGYDATRLSVADVLFGTNLGGPFFDSLQTFNDAPGVLNVAEVSFLDASDLGLVQNGMSDFVLFTILFNTLDVGISPLSLTGNIAPNGDFLGDETGMAIVPALVGDGHIEVVRRPTAVDEPSVPLLLLGALTIMTALRRLRRQIA